MSRHAAPPAPSHRPLGVGLLDLLLVLTILGILAAAAVPVWHTDQRRLDQTARQVVADLLEAQSLAIASGLQFGVRFDVSANRYEFVLASAKTPRAEETALRANPTLSAAAVARLLEASTSGEPALTDGVTLRATTFSGGGVVLFDPDGSSRADGYVDLRLDVYDRRVRVQLGTSRIAITEP